MSKRTWYWMTYDDALACWIVDWGDQMGYRLRDGDWFDLHVGYGQVLTCQAVLGQDWYVQIGTHRACFYLKRNETYQVAI
ncbi:DUF5348 domain-containing protein [Alkalicoccus luteus]